VPPEDAADAHREQDTTDFGLIVIDLSLKVEPRSAPNPLSVAVRPERLELVRREVRKIVDARRAATARFGS